LDMIKKIKSKGDAQLLMNKVPAGELDFKMRQAIIRNITQQNSKNVRDLYRNYLSNNQLLMDAILPRLKLLETLYQQVWQYQNIKRDYNLADVNDLMSKAKYLEAETHPLLQRYMMLNGMAQPEMKAYVAYGGRKSKSSKKKSVKGGSKTSRVTLARAPFI